MKVLLINGSPHERGCTYTALSEVAKALEEAGIETEIFFAGQVRSACKGCLACRNSGSDRCAVNDDAVNAVIEKALKADGFVFGSPVHYAAASGSITSLLDRCFYAAAKAFSYKPGGCVVSCRRAGASAALDQLNKYLTIAKMPVVSSQYWNMVHGNTPDEVRQDLEGLQTMRVLGENMAWLLKCIKAGEEAGIGRPQLEEKISTNFIR